MDFSGSGDVFENVDYTSLGDVRTMSTWVPICPKCGSEKCERFVESDAPPDGANVICKNCGELFRVEE